MAEALDMEVGTYEVKSIPASDLATFRYRQIPKDPPLIDTTIKPKVKRVEYVTQRQLLSKIAAGNKLTRTTLGSSGGNNFVFASGQPVVMGASNVKVSSSSTSLDNQKLGKIDSILQSASQLSTTQPRFVTVSAAPSHGGTVLTSKGMNSHNTPVTSHSKQTSNTAVMLQTMGKKSGIVNKPNMGGISLLPANLATLASAQKAVAPMSQPQPITVSMVSNFVQSTSSNTAMIQTLTNQSASSAVVESLSVSPPVSVEKLTTPNNKGHPDVVTSLTHNESLTTVPLSVVDGLVIQHEGGESIQIPLSVLPQDHMECSNGEKHPSDISISIVEQDEGMPVHEEDLQKSLGTDAILCTKNEPEDLENIMDTTGTVVEATGEFQEGEMVQFVQNQILEDNTVEGIQVPSDHIITASNIYQTADGIIIIQNQDGSTVQLQGGDGEPIPLETVQALLAMDGQLLQTTMEEGEQLLLDQ